MTQTPEELIEVKNQLAEDALFFGVSIHKVTIDTKTGVSRIDRIEPFSQYEFFHQVESDKTSGEDK